MTKKVWFKNNKRQKLAGILHVPKKFKGKKPAGVVLCHGLWGNKDRPLIKTIANGLQKAGFMVLRFDYTGNGQSAGDFRSFAYSQAIKDTKSAVDFLAKRGLQRIGLIGHSLGGDVALLEKIKDSRIHCLGLITPVADADTYFYKKKKKVKRLLQKQGFATLIREKLNIYKPFFDDLKKYNVIKAAQSVFNPVIIYIATQDKYYIPGIKKLYSAISSEVKFLKKIKADHNFLLGNSLNVLSKDITYWFSKYLHYQPPVINAFVQHKGKILLLKRSNKVGTHQKMWDCVGGYLKSDLGKNSELRVKENIKSRCYHEIKEELSIKKSELKLINNIKPIQWYDKKEDKTWLIYPFLFESKTNKIRLDWEHTEYHWIKLSEIKNYKIIPGLDKNLKKLLLKK